MVQNWDVLSKHKEEFSSFLDVETSNKPYEEFQAMYGLGTVQIKREGTPIAYDDPGQGGSKRCIMDAYALGWICTAEMLADDQYGKIKQVPKELMPSLMYQVEVTAANLLNLGFTTATTVDGVSLFNTAHPLLGPQGGTQSNRHATNSPLSQTALQDMVVLAENFVNDRNLKRYLRPTKLHISPENQWIAKKILRSDAEPGTANNDVNVTKDLVDYQILHYLTSTTAWYLSTEGTNYLKFYWRKKPSQESADDFDTKGVKHSIDARWASVAYQYFGWFGSTGVGS